MRKYLLALSLLSLCASTLFAQVKIGDNPGSVNARSLLELESTNKGLLMPRMTNGQIAAMTGAPTGMLVFSSTDSALYLRRDTGWAILALGNNPVAATNKWASSGNNIYSTNSGNVGIGSTTPSEKFTVRANGIGINQENSTGNVKVGFYTDGGGAYLQTHSNHPLYFATNNTGLQMALTTTGRLGIGNPSPIAKLDVTGDTIGLRNTAGWDNLWFTVDGSKATINASGAEAGLNFRVGSNTTGVYGNGQTFSDALTLMPTGNVGVGTTTPNASAALDVTATNKGLLVPRYTTAAISNIGSPAKGLLVYDSTLNGFYVYTGSGWLAVGDNLGNHTASQPIRLNGNPITNNGGPGLSIDNGGRVTLPSAAIGGTGSQYDFLMNNGSNNVSARKGYGGLGINYMICVEGVYPSRARTNEANSTNGINPFLGEIMLWTGNFIVQGWLPCDGRLLPINQNQALFSILGTTYGGNGQTTFALPDLRAAVPVGAGINTAGYNWTQGQKTN